MSNSSRLPTTPHEHDLCHTDRKWAQALIPKGAISLHNHGIRAYAALHFGRPGCPDGAEDGIMVALEHGPGVAFIPYTAIRGDETRAEIRASVAAAIPSYTHMGTWQAQATDEDKAKALALCAPEIDP